jgi:isoamylase
MADDGSAGPEPMGIWPGRPYPLGATWDGMGANFALFCERDEGRALPFRLGERQVTACVPL